jgi:hypothetical protein
VAANTSVRFFSENDSEVIGVYLADQLARGRSLEEAIVASLKASFAAAVSERSLTGVEVPCALR